MKTVLIVCTANMCRSPMAEGLLRRQLEREGRAGDVSVASAGVWTEDGIPATDKAVQEMATRKIDIAGHRSRAIDEDVIDGVALVLTMTHSHAEALRIAFPAQADRVHLLTELIGREYDIEDPVGGAQDDYARTASELEDLVERGFPRLMQLIGDR